MGLTRTKLQSKPDGERVMMCDGCYLSGGSMDPGESTSMPHTYSEHPHPRPFWKHIGRYNGNMHPGCHLLAFCWSHCSLRGRYELIELLTMIYWPLSCEAFPLKGRLVSSIDGN